MRRCSGRGGRRTGNLLEYLKVDVGTLVANTLFAVLEGRQRLSAKRIVEVLGNNLRAADLSFEILAGQLIWP